MECTYCEQSLLQKFQASILIQKKQKETKINSFKVYQGIKQNSQFNKRDVLINKYTHKINI